MFGFFKRKKTLPPNLSKDGMVIENLRKLGSKMDKPHEIDFFFYLPDQAAAENFAKVLQQDGYQARAFPPQEGHTEYSVQAQKSIVPTLAAMEGLTAKFEELAATYGGKYDGWGTGVEE